MRTVFLLISSNSSSAWSSKFSSYSYTPCVSYSMRSQLSTGTLTGLLFLIVIIASLCNFIFTFSSSNFIIFDSSYFSLTPPRSLYFSCRIYWLCPVLNSLSWFGYTSFLSIVILISFIGINVLSCSWVKSSLHRIFLWNLFIIDLVGVLIITWTVWLRLCWGLLLLFIFLLLI